MEIQSCGACRCIFETSQAGRCRTVVPVFGADDSCLGAALPRLGFVRNQGLPGSNRIAGRAGLDFGPITRRLESMANREELAIIRGARAGRAEAQLALGKLYLFGSAGLPKSLPTAQRQTL